MANSGKPKAIALTEIMMNNTKPSTAWINGTEPVLGAITTSKSVERSGRALHNELSNLLLLESQTHHSAFTMLQTQINRLEEKLKIAESRITMLEAENIILKSSSAEGYGNPELNTEMNRETCRDYRPPILIAQDEEIVHSCRKL